MSHLMIIDDDEDFAAAAATVLRDAGHDVTVELNVTSAEKSLINRKPDLIILDVIFPENDSAGFEFARKIKHSDRDIKDIPILILTAVNSSFSLGFSSNDIDEDWLPIETFIEKPVDFDILEKKINTIIEENNRLRNNIL
ncbi:response regulator [Candidatus Latescibacterota bacterium]